MSATTVLHSTFTTERTYAAAPAEVFAAWADPRVKARWFGGEGEHELDFVVGGREVARGRLDDGTPLSFESTYVDIVESRRIVYASTLRGGGNLATASLTTVQFDPLDGGTRLTLTEQAAFLDGHEDPAWRERGTGGWLDALGTELDRSAGGG